MRRTTGIDELDRVLGGGLVAGSVSLIGGEPGAGKSTLLQMASFKLAEQGLRALYISGEESRGQIRLSAERINALNDNLWLLSETDLDRALDAVWKLDPDF